jgi:F420 biosynthesis protein FbiB-like protein
MSAEYRPISDVIRGRRSVRSFATDPVPPVLVRDLVSLACTAPAPHHSRPWRFVYLSSPESKAALAEEMGAAWLSDLVEDNRPVGEIDRLIGASRETITTAPALLLACFVLAESRRWTDETRQLAERDMFVQSLGAALQNLLLAAVERGLTGYIKGAPLFCPGAVRSALDLPDEWSPAFLVLLGYPAADAAMAPKKAVNLDDVLLEK